MDAEVFPFERCNNRLEVVVENTSVKLVYIVTDLVEYFERMGFVTMKESSKELLDALDEACKVKGKPNTVVMVYERPGS